MRRLAAKVLCSALMVVLTATVSGAATMEKSLYDRLGGKKAIVAVVDEFVARVAADKRINGFFKDTAADPKRLAKSRITS